MLPAGDKDEVDARSHKHQINIKKEEGYPNIFCRTRLGAEDLQDVR